MKELSGAGDLFSCSRSSPAVAWRLIKCVGSARTVNTVLSDLCCGVVLVIQFLESQQVLFSIGTGPGAMLEVDLIRVGKRVDPATINQEILPCKVIRNINGNTTLVI